LLRVWLAILELFYADRQTGRRMDTLVLLVYGWGEGVAPMVCQGAEMILSAVQRKYKKNENRESSFNTLKQSHYRSGEAMRVPGG
jgi:hypothetical protein